jgi:predicted O-methyltransferase YrrM
MNDMFQLAIGVDPNQGVTLRMTSDEFFAANQFTFDIVFIDGLHDQVAKDIENSLRVLNPGGIIVMHDCNPTTKISQLRMGEENRGFSHSGYMLGYCLTMAS